ncbi:hypothetical protein B6U80_00560 [Candidatus Pacearchaeota archaeon ex4484_26]|nr:MAG: hypothetical protein B6U80_00560 [Candidatus Pacearchaeota archaeon ex4484_26]
MLNKKKKPKFLRKDWYKKSKLGKRRKKKQKWVKPRGRHNKLREKRKGHAKRPSVGYSQTNKIKGKIQGLKPVVVYNISDIKNIKQGEIAVFASVGKKKKIEMAEKCKELKVKVNFNLKKFLEKEKEKFEQRKKIKKEKEKIKKQKEKTQETETKKEEVKKEAEKTEEEKAAREKVKEKMLMKPIEKKQARIGMAEKKAIVKRKALEK